MSRSTATNGPLKQPGGGSMVHNWAAAGGKGNEPPMIQSQIYSSQIYNQLIILDKSKNITKHSPCTGCSPGSGFTFGLYGIICDKSGLGRAAIASSGSGTRGIAPIEFLTTLDTSIYPIDLNSIEVHGNKSKNLYLSTNAAVSLPSNSLI